MGQSNPPPPPDNIHRMMRRVAVVIPVDAAEWFKQKQYLDVAGNLDMLGILEARLTQERKRANQLFYLSVGLLVLLTVALKFLIK